MRDQVIEDIAIEDRRQRVAIGRFTVAVADVGHARECAGCGPFDARRHAGIDFAAKERHRKGVTRYVEIPTLETQ